MRLDLCGERIERERDVRALAQVRAVFDERLRELRPLDIRKRRVHRRVIAGGAVEFERHLQCVDLLHLPAQALLEYRELLAERGRRGGLAVRAREHRHVGAVLRGTVDPLHGELERLHQRIDGISQHQPVGDVVDIFRRASEMDPFHESAEADLPEFPPQPQLARLHIMVGGKDAVPALGLELFDREGVFLHECMDDAFERLGLGVVELQRNVRVRAERQDVAHHDVDTVFNEAEFAHDLAQRPRVAFVPAVDRRDIHQGIRHRFASVG